MLENFYNKVLTKYVSETRTIDTRDMNVYHHKLIKEKEIQYQRLITSLDKIIRNIFCY